MITRAEAPHPQRRSVGVHLLLRFLDTYPGFAAQFSGTWGRGDAEGARRLAHDLKSIAGTLGMQALYEAAQTLEHACADDAPAVPARLQQVSLQMERVLEALQSWASARPREPASPG